MAWARQMPNGRWRAEWREPGIAAPRSKASFATKAQAERYGGEQEARAQRGDATYKGRTITWGVWHDQWQQLRRVEHTTAGSDASRINRWLMPKWGDVPLGRIDQESVQLWVNALARQMSPASVEKTYRLLATSLKQAARVGRVSASPCRDIDLPPIPPSDERFLTRAEFDAVVDLIDQPYRTVYIILVGTGMRFGEVAGLHHARVDWMAQTIQVHETWDGRAMKAYPKGRRKRTVPMASWVAEAIGNLGGDERRTCGLEHVGPHGSTHGATRCRSALVAVGPLGAPLNARNMLRRHWAPAVARAGLDHARQHDLRHTTASWLAQAGRSMSEIAEVLGHSETSVTARYAHLAGTHMDAVRGVLEGI